MANDDEQKEIELITAVSQFSIKDREPNNYWE